MPIMENAFHSALPCVEILTHYMMNGYLKDRYQFSLFKITTVFKILQKLEKSVSNFQFM